MSVSDDITAAANALRRGLLVGMPTETVYGLAADATNDMAVAAIFAAKGRPRFDPLIVHVAEPAQAWTVAVPDPVAQALADAFWPGPLTLVVPRRSGIGDLVTAGLSTVAVRCPDHDVARQLIRATDRPLAAPSANRFGALSPTCAADVLDQLTSAVALVIDGGPCRVGLESTIVRTLPEPIILRPGGLSREALEHVLKRPIAIADRRQRADALALEAPGMLASHYAPTTPLVLRNGPWPRDQRTALLAFTGHDLPAHAYASEILDRDGDLDRAACRLFAALRRLDASGAEGIVAETVPERGLGPAINDRLRRAAGRG